MRATSLFGLINLKVNACILLGAYGLQENAQCTGRLTLPADHIPHVILIDVQGDEHATFVHGTFGTNVFRMVNDGFHRVFNKLLVLELFCHIGNNNPSKFPRLQWQSTDIFCTDTIFCAPKCKRRMANYGKMFVSWWLHLASRQTLPYYKNGCLSKYIEIKHDNRAKK